MGNKMFSFPLFPEVNPKRIQMILYLFGCDHILTTIVQLLSFYHAINLFINNLSTNFFIYN
jgi:hypothetical protein